MADQNSKNHIYIGKFFHRRVRELDIPDKKIGKTVNLSQREWQLGQTKSPIGYVMVAAWRTDADTEKIEQQIHALLKHNRSSGEWFDDDDGDLIARVTQFMQIGGYAEVQLEEDEDADANKVREEVTRVQWRAKHIERLTDMPFTDTYHGHQVTITLQKNGKFICVETGVGWDSMHRASVESFKSVHGLDSWGHIWTRPKNAEGKTPDEVLGTENRQI